MSVFVANFSAFLNTIFYGKSCFKNDKKSILRLHMLCNLTDIVMYVLIGGMSGLANAVASLLKNIAFVKYDSKRFTVFFSILRVSLLCLGYEGFITLCFMVIEVLNTLVVIYGAEDGFSVKVLDVIAEIIWIVYDLLFATIFIAIMTVLSTILSFAGVLASKRLRKGE